MNAQQWNTYARKIRVDAALSAYETALRWLRSYPAADVERRLIETIDSKRAFLAEARSTRTEAAGSQTSEKQD